MDPRLDPGLVGGFLYHCISARGEYIQISFEIKKHMHVLPNSGP